jgi:hypothetical protein
LVLDRLVVVEDAGFVVGQRGGDLGLQILEELLGVVELVLDLGPFFEGFGDGCLLGLEVLVAEVLLRLEGGCVVLLERF